MDTAAARVAEFVRQWEMRSERRDYNPVIYSVHFDPESDIGVDLTIDDIKALLAAAQKEV